MTRHLTVLSALGLFLLGSSPILAQSLPQFDFSAPPEFLVLPTEVRPLPGGLDQIPMFNSDSPEWPKQEGILLSTLPPEGRQTPEAHLDYAFQGLFNVFAHHFSHTPTDLRTLYIGILVHNDGSTPAKVDVLSAASFEMQEAPYREQPPVLDNPDGEIYAGPGSRAVDWILRDHRQEGFPEQITIPAGQSVMLLNHPIPVKGLERPINGRSTFMRLNSDLPVYVASLAMYAPIDDQGQERPPSLVEWQTLLTTGQLAVPRDKVPSPPDQQGGQLIYGRVAGVQMGSAWVATLVDQGASHLALPEQGQAVAYAMSTLRGGRFGTNQVQAAPMVARYSDTAYEAHGNYGVHYDLTLPLLNTSSERKTVAITLETPLKEDSLSGGGIRFRQPPFTHPFFRGTIRLQYIDETGQSILRYVHVWHRVGQILDPLLTLDLEPGQNQTLRIDFLYPPDSTPPQVLTIRTLN